VFVTIKKMNGKIIKQDRRTLEFCELNEKARLKLRREIARIADRPIETVTVQEEEDYYNDKMFGSSWYMLAVIRQDRRTPKYSDLSSHQKARFRLELARQARRPCSSITDQELEDYYNDKMFGRTGFQSAADLNKKHGTVWDGHYEDEGEAKER